MWAHKIRQTAVVYIRHRPARLAQYVANQEGAADSNHQLSGDVHVLRWRNELAALGLEHAVLDQKEFQNGGDSHVYQSPR